MGCCTSLFKSLSEKFKKSEEKEDLIDPVNDLENENLACYNACNKTEIQKKNKIDEYLEANLLNNYKNPNYEDKDKYGQHERAIHYENFMETNMVKDKFLSYHKNMKDDYVAAEVKKHIFDDCISEMNDILSKIEKSQKSQDLKDSVFIKMI
ncbi:hypothetical protein A3Q56_04707 [Intoshia linei]|uniref:Uncharacterized protein n=1 Tax=Intoshia linei TaxID=1819745 RepID=A0A177AZZ7_9BILA|nr:hypothetical protein A3Q56_04707 [Intoshia linei]